MDPLEQFHQDNRDNSLASAVSAIDDDPDKVAESIRLSQATGVPATVVHADPDNFVRQQKIAASSAIIDQNEYIRKYLQSHPLAAKVSNDDLANLDNVSQKLTVLGGPDSPANRAMQGFKEGWESFGPEFGSWLRSTPNWEGLQAAHPNIASAAQTFFSTPTSPGMVPETFFRTLSGAYHGLISGGQSAIQAWGEMWGMRPNDAQRLARDLMAEVERRAQTGEIPSDLAAAAEHVTREAPALSVYGRAGEFPPPGVSRTTDAVHSAQAEKDIDNLSEAVKESQSALTRERAPEFYKNFIREHNTGSIGISSEKVRELYGDKVPTPDDNILGWVPELRQQLEATAQTGGDISVPVADLLTHITPEVFNEIKDHIRVREDGVTIQEGKDLEAYHASPHTFEEFGPLEVHARTGEGAMMIAPGYYFSEGEGVHENYLRALGRKRPENASEVAAYNFLDDANGNIEEAKAAAVKEHGQLDAKQLASDIERLGAQRAQSYRVRIKAGREHLLDWDKPFSEQSPHVQEALKKIGAGPKDIPKDLQWVEGEGGASELPGIGKVIPEGDRWRGVSDTIDSLFATKEGAQEAILDRYTAEHGTKLAERPGSMIFAAIGQDENEAARILREAGIPGIRYLDEQSRRIPEGSEVRPFGNGRFGVYKGNRLVAGFDSKEEAESAVNRTSNLVIFDPSLVQILTRNGEVLAAERKAAGLGTLIQHTEPISFQKGESLSVSQALDRLGTASHPNKAVEKVLQVVKDQLKKLVGDVNIRFIGDEEAGAKKGVGTAVGAYNETRDIITVNADYLARNPDDLHNPILHEALHAALGKALDKNDNLKRVVRSLMAEFRYALAEKQKSHLMGSTFARAFVDEHEFLSEALSRPDIQEILATSKPQFEVTKQYANSEHWSDRVQTVWRALIQTVRKLLGVPEEHLTNLEALLRVTDEAWYRGQKERGVSTHYVPEAETPATAMPQAAPPVEPPKPPETPRPSPPTEPPTEPTGEKKPFTAQALKLSKPTLAKWERLIARRDSEDVAAAERRLLREETRRQTKEWKENEAALRPDAESMVMAMPVSRVNRFMQGEGVDKIPGLDPEKVQDWVRDVLPRGYLKKGGLDPDVVGDMFGYDSGKDMLIDLGRYHKERISLSKTQGEYFQTLVDREVERQMKEAHGSLEDNILSEIREQIVSPTQMDLLHEETLALGQAAGVEFTLTKDDVTKMVQDAFANRIASKQSLKKALQESGRAGEAMLRAFLSGDLKEAFRQRQRQTYIMAAAQEIKKLDKEEAKFNKLAKGLANREPNGLYPEWTNFIHSVMVRVGLPVKRSVQDIAKEIDAGVEKNLRDFIDRRSRLYMRDFDIPEYLLNEGWRKPLDEMTVQEWRDVTKAITTMAKQARDEQTITIAGQKFDRSKLIGRMGEQMKDVAQGKIQLGEASETALGGLKYRVKTAGVSALQLEAVFNRIDRGDAKGAFNQIIMDIIAGQNNLSTLQRKYSKLIEELDDGANLNKRIDNKLITNPMTWEIGPDGREVPGTGTPMAMTKGHLRAILQYVGSESGFEKITRGYGINPEQFKAWLYLNAEHDDWVWAAKMGDIFKQLKDEIDVMYREQTGIAPEDIQLRPIDVRFPDGSTFQHPGWYSPLIYHDKWEFGLKGQDAADILDSKYNFRATTFAGHTKRRTNYAAPLSLDLNHTIMRMAQMLNDLAMRPSITEAAKIFYDPKFKKDMAKYMGKHYEEMLIPYLRDVAATGYYRSDLEKVGATQLEFYRRNAMATLVGLNPGTVLKHGPTAWANSMIEVGSGRYLKALTNLLKRDEITSETNWRFAKDTSEELQRRDQHWRESIQGAQDTLGPRTLRENIMYYASKPLALSDLLSAVPTWMAAYEKAMEEGEFHGDAVRYADRAVRRAHGSSAITSKPGVMRGSPLSRWFTSFYVFFNHIVNRQYEMVWQGAEALRLVRQGDMADGLKLAGKIAGPMLFSYILFPALIEEIVNPLPSDHKDSWAMWGAKMLAKDVTASWIGYRDLADAMLTGRDPHMGLIDSAVQPFTNTYRDLMKPHPFGREHMGKLLRDGLTFVGMATGLVNAQAGRTAQFIYNYGTGQEHPKGFNPFNRKSWPGAIWHGTTKEPRK